MSSEIQSWFRDIIKLLKYADIDIAHALDSFYDAVEVAKNVVRICNETTVKTRDDEIMCNFARLIISVENYGICGAYFAIVTLKKMYSSSK